MLAEKYYRTEGVKGYAVAPQFINEWLTIEQWRSYVSDYNFGALKPSRLIMHHTWSPTIDSWRGLTTMRSMQKYYAELGWNAGPHIYVAPDGIWLASPMNTIGIHANAGNGGYSKGRLAWYSIGVEMVGNYDKVKPAGGIWSQTLEVFGGLTRRLGLPVSSPAIEFHRTYNNQKSCPGWAVTKDWVFSELNAWLAQPKPRSAKVVSGGLDIHQGPATTYPVAGHLKKGEVVMVDVIKVETQGPWYHLADGRGFISCDPQYTSSN